MAKPEPFSVRDHGVSHLVIEVFGGDNNLSPYVLEELQEMAGKKGFAWVQEARAYTQACARRDTYDVKDFATQLREVVDVAEVKTACDGMVAAFRSRARAFDRSGRHGA